MILLMAGILRLIFSSLGFITGIVAGLLCARFSRDVSPGWAVAIGLIVGSVVGLGCCTSWGFEIFDISMIQYILIGGSVSAVPGSRYLPLWEQNRKCTPSNRSRSVK